MTNTNVLKGVICPTCRSEGPFNIEAKALFLDVTDDGTGDYEDVEWHYDSTITCKCGHVGEIREFQTPKKTIVVKHVDVKLLRTQRDYLLGLPQSDSIKGLVNMLDDMLDFAEGYKP